MTDQGVKFVHLLSVGDYKTAVAKFDETMKQAMPEDKIRQVWKTVIATYGPFKKQTEVRVEKLQEYDVVFVTCEFERSVLDIKVVYNGRKEVSGLWFVTVDMSNKYQVPSYIRENSFREEEVMVGNDEWSVPGTLTIPVGGNQASAVVLVHGSGPQDRDETIGPNKPFRDIAWGLSSRGIAVLRYEKRTRYHLSKYVTRNYDITIDEETVDDAVKAVQLLLGSSGIDRKNVFVLGHSLGGMMIPKIGSRESEIKGFIIMAGSSRPLEDVLLEQVKYINSLDGIETEEEKKQLDLIEAQILQIKDKDLASNASPGMMLLGVPVKYWLDMRDYNPTVLIKKIDRPVLVLQGKRDYQVSMADLRNWRRALAGQEHSEIKVYANLNHLFIEGQGKSKPEEYRKAGNVAKVVIDDIAEWINRQ
ncbi:MAG: hypothetical protein A2Y62_06920 [Candidatus Fischerbacteria bacterium RBG_13_37_8]|uniref:Serine aminopeptidase S33 domain-containing protein n=1 Tax=Candidatus Fischerbacteria bacterium RBG_13_37_8 TaxID=1817863 RepID=A0A1F5VMB9_9BACT|nr:MAG: hypothetical protein A2Y62_06920 [Candidatus Fischerbacteria bacterium RBG_13_37_8]